MKLYYSYCLQYALCKLIHLISGETKIQHQAVNPKFCFPIVMPSYILSKEYDISGIS